MQNFFELVKSSNFYAPSKYFQMPPFWFATEFNGAWVEGWMWRQIENTMILLFACLLVFVGKAEKVLRKFPSQVHWCSNSTNLQEVLHFTLYRFYVGMISLKRRKKKATGQCRESETCKWRERESLLGVRWSVPCISNQMISFDTWIFRKRKGFCGLHGLSKTAFLSIHAAVVGSKS